MDTRNQSHQPRRPSFSRCTGTCTANTASANPSVCTHPTHHHSRASFSLRAHRHSFADSACACSRATHFPPCDSLTNHSHDRRARAPSADCSARPGTDTPPDHSRTHSADPSARAPGAHRFQPSDPSATYHGTAHWPARIARGAHSRESKHSRAQPQHPARRHSRTAQTAADAH